MTDSDSSSQVREAQAAALIRNIIGTVSDHVFVRIHLNVHFVHIISEMYIYLHTLLNQHHSSYMNLYL